MKVSWRKIPGDFLVGKGTIKERLQILERHWQDIKTDLQTFLSYFNRSNIYNYELYTFTTVPSKVH